MRVIKIFLFSTIFIVFLQTNVFGQSVKDSTTIPISKHSIGIGAGFTTGVGLSYIFLPKRFGVQINLGPTTSKTSQFVSAGLTFLYRIKQGSNLNLLMYQGNHYFYKERSFYSYKQSHNFNIGLGIGLETFKDNIGFYFMSGFARYSNLLGVGLTVESGLYYKL
ncbi:MAG: hypothetical protein JXR58_11855 [Bacteroidales bacterium]|nr:hypothetical protein [Bacteroidales bacterium]